MQLAPTPRDELLHDGSATLLRFRGQERGGSPGVPVLLVPSLINRVYVLDLRRQASLVEALVAAGLDVFCVDWGVPRDEDRHLAEMADRLEGGLAGWRQRLEAVLDAEARFFSSFLDALEAAL